MTLRNAIGAPLPLPPASIPKQPKIQKKRIELEQRYSAAAANPLNPLDAQALDAQFRSALRTDRWDDITRRDWRRIPWIAFDGIDPLADSSVFLDRLLGQFRERRKRSACRSLITMYLRSFDPQKRSFEHIGQELSQAATAWDWPWRDRHMRLALFSPKLGPRKLAAYVLDAEVPPMDSLSNVGFDASLRTGGFAEAAYLEAVSQVGAALPKGSSTYSALQRLLDWSIENGKLLYPDRRGDLADALLRPWKVQDPQDAIKEKILAFLLQYLNDPRVAHAQWSTVSDDAKAVMRRWLTREALEQFINVIDYFAVEHMWRYRRAFWMAYFERGVVSDAKVLFGPNAHKYAREAFGKGQSFGMLDRVGVDANHSVLLLQIGKLTIADWSHNGKCHIWRDGNRSAPVLWPNPPKHLYHRDELRTGSDNKGVSHMSSETGSWQHKIAEYVRRYTNVSVPARQYMP